MRIVLLHLSDIHVSKPTDPILGRSSLIAATTFKHLPTADALFITVSGDIAFSGKLAEYELAERLFQQIASHIGNEKTLPIHIICVPGNHDCDFSLSKGARKAIITSVANGSSDIDDDVVEECTKVQEPFFAFRHRQTSILNNVTFKDRLIYEYTFPIGDSKIVFECLNVAWMAQLDDPQGALIFPTERYSFLENREATFKVAIMHHPLNWYNQGSYHKFRTFVRRIANLVISGHEHTPLAGENIDTHTQHTLYIEAGALQEAKNPAESVFNVVVLDIQNETYSCEEFRWSKDRYIPSEASQNVAWHSLRKYHSGSVPGFNVTDDFFRKLESAGAPFRHPRCASLQLSDIYIYPDLRPIVDSGEKLKDLSSSKLLELDFVGSATVLRGVDKSGKTSLLYQLHRHYFHESLIPVYLNEEHIDRFSEEEVRRSVDRAVAEQYGKDAVIPFQQTSKEKKLLLLDGLDKIGKNPKYRANVVKTLLGMFSHVVATSGDVSEIGELLSADLSSAIAGWRQYRILPFGYKLRLDLTKRWEALGVNSETSEKDFVGHIDRAERLLNAVVGRNVVPCVPFYLLTLLQSFESSQQGELQNSAFGYYYQYLITQSMGRVAIRREQLDEFFNYCCQIAWFFKGLNRKEVSRIELRNFNETYSRKYYPIDFETRIGQLVEAEILEARGEYLSFKYPYFYYFFVGKYLADHITDPDVKDIIYHHSNHLYVTDYANTILFLSHHSKNEYVCDCVVGVLKGLFSEVEMMRFDKDADLINKLIDSAPTLIFGEHEGDVVENRRSTRALQDDLEANHHPSQHGETLQEKLDTISKINLMFKTAEILGQILKNHYGSLPIELKNRYLDEVFQGPLRALRVLIESLLSEQETLIKLVKAELDKRDGDLPDDEKIKVGQKVLFEIATFISTAFIKKISDSVNSEYLRDTIRQVVGSSDSNSYKLIELAVKLDSPEEIPFDEIEALKKTSHPNVFLIRMLQAQAFMHLYMFNTDEREKQKIASLLGIQMKQQRLVDGQTKETKKLN